MSVYFMSAQKTIVINGKHSCDVLNVKKEHRVRIGSGATEFDHSQTKSCLILDDVNCLKAIGCKILGYKYQDNKKKNS